MDLRLLYQYIHADGHTVQVLAFIIIFACLLICADTKEADADGADTEDGAPAKKHKPDHSEKGVLYAHKST